MYAMVELTWSLFILFQVWLSLLGFFIMEDFLMELGFTLLFNSILLGAGLAMDAFSVSLANGLNDP